MPVEDNAGPALNSVGLVLLVIWKFTVCPPSPGPPGEMLVAKLPTDCPPASSSDVCEALSEKLGASLTSVTVMTKVCVGDVSTPLFAVPPLSDSAA